MPDQPRKKKGSSLLVTAVLGLLGAMIPTLVIILLVRTCEDPVMERNYRYQREKRVKRVAQAKQEVQTEVVEEAVADTLTDEDAYLTIGEELLALAPGFYLSVRFLHENGDALSLDDLQESEGVHMIEITVMSESWDAMNPEGRVDLLNNTFKFIKDHYPDMTKFLRLAYDDGRPAFDMMYGSEI